MNVIININDAYAQQAAQPAQTVPKQPAAPTRDMLPEEQGDDVVELSGEGLALSQATRESSERLARVRAIREEIENGTFETDERIQGTVDILLSAILSDTR